MTNSATPLSPPEIERDLKTEQTAALVKTLIASLPDEQRLKFLRELTAQFSSPAHRGEVLGKIIQFLDHKKTWTVAELKQRVDAEGVTASSKDVYNAIGYLYRKGRVRRIGYGRYFVDGYGVVATSDDFGGQTASNEDAYRTDRSAE